MDSLHHHGIALQNTDPAHVAVNGETASWACMGNVTSVPSEAHGQTGADVEQNVRGLAATLFYLATGQAQYTDQVALPDPAAAVFARALGSPRALGDAASLGAGLEAALEELRRPASVTLVAGRCTDVGRDRILNEDSLLSLELASVFRSVSVPLGLYVVADGMGGHEAGDVASRLAVQAIAQRAVGDLMAPAVAGQPLPDSNEWLVEVAQAANRAVHDQRKTAGTDMGTTLVMALLAGDMATVANVGDSRAYLLQDEGITQITTDHSLVERLVATGQITAEEAADHPKRNVIYRVVGDKPHVEADLFHQRLAPGHALLLCSDGLNGMVGEDRIWQIWKSSTSPQDACDRLAEAANEAGGEDNVTVVIVQVAH
jgi:protein phosphatase